MHALIRASLRQRPRPRLSDEDRAPASATKTGPSKKKAGRAGGSSEEAGGRQLRRKLRARVGGVVDYAQRNACRRGFLYIKSKKCYFFTFSHRKAPPPEGRGAFVVGEGKK